MARAYNQAQKFGAQMVIPAEVSGLQAPQTAAGIFQLRLSNEERVSARSVVYSQRRSISKARRRKPGDLRGGERALLGVGVGRQLERGRK